MKKYNANNERIKRKYLHHLQYADRKNEKSLDKAASAIERFEAYTAYKPFNKFHIEQAMGFQRHLDKAINQRTGRPISKATISGILSAMKKFTTWLAGQQGYKARIRYSDADYFNLNAKDVAIAHARRPKRYPSLEQVLHVLASMPFETDIELRNRALIALTLVTEARVGALRSFKLSHIDLIEGTIFQDARDVDTKFSKTFMTTFCPVDDLPIQIVDDYVTYLRKDLLFGPDDPLFPKTIMKHKQGIGFQSNGFGREHWKGTQSIRDIFKQAFENAGIAYYHPHSIRDTLAEYAVANATSLEQLIAISKNFGHANLATTLNSYGGMNEKRQNELIRNMKPK